MRYVCATHWTVSRIKQHTAEPDIQSTNVASALSVREAAMNAHQYRLALLALFAPWTLPAVAQPDPLPPWNDGLAKQPSVAFVTGVTRQGSPDFVPEAERVATFD